MKNTGTQIMNAFIFWQRTKGISSHWKANGAAWRLFALLLITFLPQIVVLQAKITRTPWQMNRGAGPQCAEGLLQGHGDTNAYRLAVIPATNAPGWGSAPNGDTIGFAEASVIPGTIFCNGRFISSCLNSVDFTYFQTFVTVPPENTVGEFKVTFSGIDDGAMITVFNSTYPQGVVVPGSFVFFLGTGTANLASLIVAGEVNRVVVTQMDDCAVENNLRVAQVVLNSSVLPVNRPPTVTITNPANGATFIAGANIPITANAADPDGQVNLVAFYTNDVRIATFTNAPYSMVLSNVVAGSYTLTAKARDDGGLISTSAPVNITVQLPTVTLALYNSGVDNNGGLLADGIVDPHYRLIQSTDPAFPGPNAWVAQVRDFLLLPGNWMPNGPRSKWIGPRSDVVTGTRGGTYVWRTTFDLTKLDPRTALITGLWASDNLGVDIRINGTSSGISNSADEFRFRAFSPFTINSGFVSGVNTLDFVVQETVTGTPTGLRVELGGTAKLLPFSLNQPPTVTITGPTNGATFIAGTNIPITANAADPDGQVALVGLYTNDVRIITFTNAPYSMVLSNATVGTYTLTAKARDDGGLISTSAPVNITVSQVQIGVPAVASLCGNNLVVNGNAETATGSSTGQEVVNVPGWATKGNFTVIRYTRSISDGLFPTPTDPGPLNRGQNYFAGGPFTSNSGATSSASQVIDVSPMAASIDTGKMQFTLSGFLGGWTIQRDNAFLGVSFKNDRDNPLGGASLGPVTPTDRTNKTALLLRSTTGTVPIGTRRVELLLQMTRLEGNDNDGYADNLSLVLTGCDSFSSSPPVVNILSPSDGAVFTARANVPIIADASAPDGSIVKVEFFQGSTKLGEDSTAPYSMVWSNVAVGSYLLTARAINSLGLMAQGRRI